MTYNNFDIRSGGTCQIPEARQKRLRELAGRLREGRVRQRQLRQREAALEAIADTPGIGRCRPETSS